MTEAQIEQFVDAVLKLHGMQLDDATRKEVLNQFTLLSGMHQIVGQEALAENIESASVFRL